MKSKLLLICFFLVNFSFSQIGINVTNPKATLDIEAINPTGSFTNVDGIVIPRVDRERAQNMTSIEVSTIIYINDETTGAALGIASNINQKGFYYFDGVKWSKFNLATSSAIDIGYIVGWSANTNPPDYLLPISGGTFNWLDYPDLQLLHSTHPIQFIQSSTATSFTLKDINNSGKFLRGNSVSGLEQSQGTALPTTSFATNSTGDHSHTVDPASVNTTSDGGHQHNLNMVSKDDGNFSNVAGQHPTGDANKFNGANHYIQTEAAGTHTHSVDIPLTTSSTTGNHSHTIISGGDAETRPTNISVVWCLKGKPTNSSGSITINNGNITSLTSIGSSGASTLSGSTLNIPQYNSATFGDVKTGIQTSDHNGWIKLDGRLKSLLSTSQQSQATALGIGTNLPDASNSVLMQNGTALGTVSGSNSKTIAQANIPNYNLPLATTTTDGIHSHGHNASGTSGNYGLIRRSTSGQNATIATTDSGGSGNEPDVVSTVSGLSIDNSTGHTHSVTVSSGGSGTPFDITPKSLSVNTFIYLGN